MILTEEEDEDFLVEEGPQIERVMVFLRDTCHCEIYQSNIRDKRLPREACFHLGDVKVEMKRRMKTFSWRKDLKLNAARCFTGTHATVRFTKETFVTSGSRVKRVLIWAMSKWTKYNVTFNEEEDEDTLVEEDLKLNAARCSSGTHAVTWDFSKKHS